MRLCLPELGVQRLCSQPSCYGRAVERGDLLQGEAAARAALPGTCEAAGQRRLERRREHLSVSSI